MTDRLKLLLHRLGTADGGMHRCRRCGFVAAPAVALIVDPSTGRPFCVRCGADAAESPEETIVLS